MLTEPDQPKYYYKILEYGFNLIKSYQIPSKGKYLQEKVPLKMKCFR